MNHPDNPGNNPVGLAIIAGLLACLLIPLPLVLIVGFFGLLIAIAIGVWRIASRPPR